MSKLYSVLIVDDESILRNGLKYICDWEKEGFQLIGEASNGREALEIIKREEPNIVITDLIMPEIDGVELIKFIKKDYPNIKVLVLSNVSEFEYVKDTFKYGINDYLLKTEASAENILSVLKNMVKEIGDIDINKKKIDEMMVIESILLNFLENKEVDTEKLYKVKEYFKLDNFYIMVSEFYEIEDGYLYLNDIKNKINNIIKDYLEVNTYITLFIKTKLIIIINHDKFKDIKLNYILKSLSKSLIEAFNIKAFILSESIDDILKISIKYNEILNLIGKTIYFDSFLINSSEIYIQDKDIKFDYDIFNSYIGRLDFKEAIDFISRYFKSIKENVFMDEYDLKKFSQNLIYNVLNTLENIETDLINISRKKIILFKKIDIARSFDEILNIVIDTFNEIEKVSINNLNSKSNTYIIKMVKDYVDKNYKDDISVATIANNLNINYNYLSYCFKNETNENLSYYISKIRIEKAKLYLEDAKIPISNISEMVGFSEHNYFSKIFKKYTSLTPSEYRRMAKINAKKR